MRRTKRAPAYQHSEHQIDELFIGDADYSVQFGVHWELNEDFDGKPHGYQIDTIDYIHVGRWNGEKYVAVEVDDATRSLLEANIRETERQYGSLHEEMNEQLCEHET